MSDRSLMPHHVAIIMDGNRRWASERGEPAAVGHWQGATAIFDIVEAVKELGVKVLTLWGFSTENWKRSTHEVALLMHIVTQYLQTHRAKMVEKGVKFSMIGDFEPLPFTVKEEMKQTIEATKQCKEIDLIFAFNYGGKDDIRRAFLKIMEKIEKKELVKEEVNEGTIARHLDTAAWPDPDLVIRTSREQRVSNFFLWQLAYSEIFISDVLWPDFTAAELIKAVKEYEQRQRRMGR